MQTDKISIFPISAKRHRLAVFTYFCSTGIVFASWASRIPTIQENLMISEGELGLLLLMMPLGQLFTLPLSGRLVTKFGSATILSNTLIIYISLLLTISFIPNKYLLAPVLMCFGIASNMCNIAVNTQAIGVEKLYVGKPIMTTFHGGWSFAGFAGALIGMKTLHYNLSTTTHFFIIGTLIIINTLINRNYLIAKDNKPENHSKDKQKFKPDTFLIQLGIIGFCSMATEGAMFDWSGVYFDKVVHADEKWIILGYTAFMVMMATGRFVGDFAIKKMGTRNVLLISGVLMSTGMMLSVIFPNLIVATISFMLVGIGVACCVPTVYSLAGNHSKIPAGIALALVSSISFLGFLFGPPLIGFIAELFSLKVSFTIFSFFGLMMVFLVLKKKKW